MGGVRGEVGGWRGGGGGGGRRGLFVDILRSARAPRDAGAAKATNLVETVRFTGPSGKRRFKRAFWVLGYIDSELTMLFVKVHVAVGVREANGAPGVFVAAVRDELREQLQRLVVDGLVDHPSLERSIGSRLLCGLFFSCPREGRCRRLFLLLKGVRGGGGGKRAG